VLSVWVRGQGDVLVRADAITVLALGPEGLRAEWGARRAVRLTGTPCSTAVQLELLAAIQRAAADGRTVVIMPPAEVDSSEWRWSASIPCWTAARGQHRTANRRIEALWPLRTGRCNLAATFARATNESGCDETMWLCEGDRGAFQIS